VEEQQHRRKAGGVKASVAVRDDDEGVNE